MKKMLIAWAISLAIGCSGENGAMYEIPDGGDSDTDTDGDSDTDSDTDSDVCGDGPFDITGSLETNVADITFTSAVIGIQHKQDVDPIEDGCITSINLLLSTGGGCELSLVASDTYSTDDGLLVQNLSFNADSFCPYFLDDHEGVYVDEGGVVTAEIEPGVTSVPCENAAECCFDSTLTVRLQGVLGESTSTKTLTVGSTTITVDGQFLSAGDTSVNCPGGSDTDTDTDVDTDTDSDTDSDSDVDDTDPVACTLTCVEHVYQCVTDTLIAGECPEGTPFCCDPASTDTDTGEAPCEDDVELDKWCLDASSCDSIGGVIVEGACTFGVCCDTTPDWEVPCPYDCTLEFLCNTPEEGTLYPEYTCPLSSFVCCDFAEVDTDSDTDLEACPVDEPDYTCNLHTSECVYPYGYIADEYTGCGFDFPCCHLL